MFIPGYLSSMISTRRSGFTRMSSSAFTAKPNQICYTDKKEYEIFLIYKELQMGSVAKSYIRKGSNMRSPLVRYDFATAPF
jgi:hypothetical protein